MNDVYAIGISRERPQQRALAFGKAYEDRKQRKRGSRAGNREQEISERFPAGKRLSGGDQGDHHKEYCRHREISDHRSSAPKRPAPGKLASGCEELVVQTEPSQGRAHKKVQKI